MTQFRLKAISTGGRAILKEFEADNQKEAKDKVDRLALTNNLTVQAIEKKATFMYKVKRPGKPALTGEQEAYSKEEVENALVKLGYQVISINKKMFEMKGGVPHGEVVTFISLSADLLNQGLGFDEILDLLIEDTANKRMKDVIRIIQKDLKDGKEGTEVYGKHEAIFGKFAAYMLSVASTSGNMALVFESTAKFLERDAEFKKNMRRSLMMPAVTVIAVIGVVLFYVAYIFPETALMFLNLGIELPPMTDATLKFSFWLSDNWIIILASFLIPTVGLIMYFKTPKGELFKDKYIIKLPVMGDLLHKTSIEIFARVFYTLYSG